MSNIHYIYYLLIKLINFYVIGLLLTMNTAHPLVSVLIYIVGLYYLLHKNNLENRFISKKIYLKPLFLFKRIAEIIITLTLISLNLTDVVLIIYLFDYIVKLTLDVSCFELYYSDDIKIRRKDESKT